MHGAVHRRRCLCALRSDVFGDYVGQLQMASIVTISVEGAGEREISRQEVMAKLAPIQQVRLPLWVWKFQLQSNCTISPCRSYARLGALCWPDCVAMQADCAWS